MGDPSGKPGLGLLFDTLNKLRGRIQKLERRSVEPTTVQALVQARAQSQRLVYTYPGVPAFTSAVTSQSLPVTWVTPFVDTNYTVITDVALPSGSTAVTSCSVTGKTVNGCTVTIKAGGAAIPAGSVLTADGIHL